MPHDNLGSEYKITRADHLNATGGQLFHQSQIEAARLHFLAALSLEPNHGQALQNLGACLRVLQHYEAAASVARRSVMASNNNPYARSNLGVSMMNLRRYDESLAILQQVAKDLPDSPGSWHNLALMHYVLGQYENALLCFNQSLELNPDNKQVQSDKSLTLLAMGQISRGLQLYESRWFQLHRNKIWDFGFEEWQGQPLAGKTILVHHEQGFGDSIMLVRFLTKLTEEALEVTFAVPPELERLFAVSFPDVSVINMETAEILHDRGDRYDYHSPLLSAARWSGWSSPKDIDPTPYLKAPEANDVVLPEGKLTIGLCWASGNHGPAMAERRRVIDVTQFLPLTELNGTVVVSLQKGGAGRDLQINGLEGIIVDVTGRLEDFSDTADVIANLDLVISVDSAVAHLAGALGKPCLMLSPYSRCWRWWDEATGKPWYNNMTIYKQSANGAWNDAVAAVQRDVTGIWANK